MAIVTFVYSDWAAAYPELATFTTEGAATGYFGRATLLLDNTDSSPSPYTPPAVTERLTLLYLLVAHIAALSNPQRAGLTGRVSSATQGSVSVSLELSPSAGRAYYNQTAYGLEYWEATAKYRMFRPYVGPQPFFQPRYYRPR